MSTPTERESAERESPAEREPAQREPATRRGRASPGRVVARVVTIVLTVALVAGLAWALTHRQRVTDQFAFWGFQPSAVLQSYADRSTMTDEGRFLFFASKPVVAAATQFDGVCASHREDVGILGCYLPADRTIFLFDVTDPRLDGLAEVVAAHEMLHAAWDRMSEAERSALAPLLEAEAAKRVGDKAFAQTLAFYATAEPGERLNELHSIIGTEFGEVSAALEAHYGLYFADRRAVTGMHERSNAVFVEQAARIQALVTQIDALAAGIDADYAQYNAGYDRLSADIRAFNARADSGGFTSQAEFTAERNSLLQRQHALDASYASIAARSAQYTDLLAQLKSLNAQADQLNKSINITPRAPTKL